MSLAVSKEATGYIADHELGYAFQPLVLRTAGMVNTS
jgi:hypothetical protein